mgnify:CR=1 FL=1|jgi:UDP-N-acetylglucosamine 3-dehydrogenase
MSSLRVAIIGTGRPHGTPGATGFGMAHQHAKAYKASGEAELVAVCDIVVERARQFQEEHGAGRVYEDYRAMLAQEKPDMVSICTWPHLHAEMVLAAVEAGVRAIHCEKPMAPTYGEALRMARAARERGVQLTFNHQRRFGEPFRKAKELLAAGAIGRLARLEAACDNLFDWGTHWFDMLFFYNDETPVDWVIGQIEVRGNRKVFGAPVEGQGLSHFKFRNGVRGTVVTGYEASIGAENRLIGTDGVIEIGTPDRIVLRMWGRGQSQWEDVKVSEGIHGGEMINRAILDAITSLKTGREPELSARKALQATELIFATYESSRRRGRVDLPLRIEDSPLAEIIEQRR